MTETLLHATPNAPWNKNTRLGFVLSLMLPLAAVLIVNAIVFAAGVNEPNAAYQAVPFNPPGWLIGAIWIVLYPMWGAAHWYARQTGIAGRRASRGVLALTIWGLLYPFVTAGAETPLSVLVNIASLALAAIAAWNVRAVSKRAFWLMAPSLAWLGFANVLGLAALYYGQTVV